MFLINSLKIISSWTYKFLLNKLVNGLILLSVSALKFNSIITSIIAAIIVFTYHFTRKKKPTILQPIIITIACLVISFGVQFFYGNILKPHQQDRISLWLRLEKDPAKIEQFSIISMSLKKQLVQVDLPEKDF